MEFQCYIIHQTIKRLCNFLLYIYGEHEVNVVSTYSNCRIGGAKLLKHEYQMQQIIIMNIYYISIYSCSSREGDLTLISE